MDIIKFKDREYPHFQCEGNAAQFAIPYAKYFCVGTGFDVGCMKKEWSLPGSIPVDLSFYDDYDALNLPDMTTDYIFSSHCLEHVDDWIEVLNYWTNRLRTGGILFLYLPHYNQEYWRPWNNRKHKHILTPKIIKDYLEAKDYKNIFVSKRDLNDSFMVVSEK